MSVHAWFMFKDEKYGNRNANITEKMFSCKSVRDLTFLPTYIKA